MSRYNYRGDTWPKRLARSKMWVDIRVRLHEKQIDPSVARVAVLSGPAGGDIRCARAIGVEMRNIIACEQEHAAADECERNVPGCAVRRGDVFSEIETWHRRTGNRLDVLLLDFCTVITAEMWRRIMRVARSAVRDGGIVCAGFMYGRDLRDPLLRERVELMMPHVSADPTNAGLSAAYVSRCLAMWNLATRAAHACGSGLEHPEFLGYQSRTETSPGTPMCFLIAEQRKICAARCRCGGPIRHFPLFMSPAMAMAEVRQWALRAAKDHDWSTQRVADLFGIPQRTVTAWMAHETRGTYGAEAAE